MARWLRTFLVLAAIAAATLAALYLPAAVTPRFSPTVAPQQSSGDALP